MQYDWSPYAIGGALRPDSFTSMTPGMQSGLWGLLQAAGEELGPGLQVYSGYRSPERQAELYANALAKYGSPEAARKWVAPPGKSQHNSGNAADLKFNGARLTADSDAGRWVAENAAKYGLAVPMSWEPWQVELAGAREGLPSPAISFPETAPVETSPFDMPTDLSMGTGELGLMDRISSLAEIAAQATAPQVAPAPLMAPSVQSYQPVKRDTAAPYLQLFQQLAR